MSYKHNIILRCTTEIILIVSLHPGVNKKNEISSGLAHAPVFGRPYLVSIGFVVAEVYLEIFDYFLFGEIIFSERYPLYITSAHRKILYYSVSHFIIYRVVSSYRRAFL